MGHCFRFLESFFQSVPAGSCWRLALSMYFCKGTVSTFFVCVYFFFFFLSSEFLLCREGIIGVSGAPGTPVSSSQGTAD